MFITPIGLEYTVFFIPRLLALSFSILTNSDLFGLIISASIYVAAALLGTIIKSIKSDTV